jgi:hypothetical protein
MTTRQESTPISTPPANAPTAIPAITCGGVVWRWTTEWEDADLDLVLVRVRLLVRLLGRVAVFTGVLTDGHGHCVRMSTVAPNKQLVHGLPETCSRAKSKMHCMKTTDGALASTKEPNRFRWKMQKRRVAFDERATSPPTPVAVHAPSAMHSISMCRTRTSTRRQVDAVFDVSMQ